jgi:hypothetical protein
MFFVIGGNQAYFYNDVTEHKANVCLQVLPLIQDEISGATVFDVSGDSVV